jgi:hypothetical protein
MRRRKDEGSRYLHLYVHVTTNEVLEGKKAGEFEEEGRWKVRALFIDPR